jgi:hypothetical protein
MTAFISDHATIVFIVLASGWALAILVLVLLIVLVGKWKTAFSEKEWTLVPTLEGTAMVRAAEVSSVQMKRLEEVVLAAAEITRETREEFGILGRDLDAKAEEIRSLRMGAEYHHRKALILAAIRTLEAIGIDQAAGATPETTFRGIAIDLGDVLEENHVECFMPLVGERVPTRGVESAKARRIVTTDSTLVGTIASVERPAYIASGPGGFEELLQSAAVTIYVLEESVQ